MKDVKNLNESLVDRAEVRDGFFIVSVSGSPSTAGTMREQAIAAWQAITVPPAAVQERAKPAKPE